MLDELGYSSEKVKKILQEESGMNGLTGYSDLREIETKAEQGDEICLLALKMNAYRVKKFIGAYATIMNGLDAIVFTAGVGENSSIIRKLVCENMEFLGMKLDNKKNQVRAKVLTEINKEDSRVKILIIPTNEEIEIARQSYDLLSK